MIVKVVHGGRVADFFAGRELTANLIYCLMPPPDSTNPWGTLSPLYGRDDEYAYIARLFDFARDTTHYLDADGRDIHRTGEWFGWLMDLAREHGWEPTL